MEPLQQLDAILFFIKGKTQFGVSFFNIKKYVEQQTQLGIDEPVLREILAFLESDSRIRILNHSMEGKSLTYRITFSGLVFDGYVKAKEIGESEAQWQKTIAALTVSNAKFLNRLTLWLTVFTGIAAMYYIIEISKNFSH